MERIVELVGNEWRCDLDEFTTLVSLDKTLLEEELDRLEATGRLGKDVTCACFIEES